MEERRKKKREKFKRRMNDETGKRESTRKRKMTDATSACYNDQVRVASRDVTPSTWPTYTKDLTRKNLANDD